MEELRYLYRVDTDKKWLGVGFFIACGLYGAYLALTTDRGLIIDGFIKLNMAEASIFYWGLTALSVGMAVYGLYGIIAAPTGARYVHLTDQSIMAPKSSISRIQVKIAYNQITKLELQTIHGQRFLAIFHQGGKLSLYESVFVSKAKFEDMCKQLGMRTSAARAANLPQP